MRKCNPKNRLPSEPKCAKPADIDKWIRDKGIMIESWVVHQKINFDKYREIPTFYSTKMINEVYVNPDIMQQRYMFLRENEAESEEDWF